MNQDFNQGAGSPAPPSSITPEQYATLQQRNQELEQYYSESQQFVERIQPYAPQIKRLVEDEDARRIYDDSLSAYDTLRERQRPKLSPEWDPEVNPWLKKIDEVSQAVSKFSKNADAYEQQQQQQQKDRVLQENAQLANKLCADYPVLAENDFAGINAISMMAMGNGMTFEEAARRMEPVYKAQARQMIDEPSLRSGAGAQGVPGPSEENKDISMRERFIQIMETAH